VSETLRVACVQMSSSNSLAQNLSVASHRIRQATACKSQLLVLPENFAWVGKDISLFTADSSSVIKHFLGECAKQYQVWIVAGTVLWKSSEHEKPFNRSLVINPQGEICCYYDKIHLFEAVLTHEFWKKSDDCQVGKKPSIFHLNDDWHVGLSICYDLRFPRLYNFHAAQGGNILTVPSAFTLETGQAHWEVLLRARAIENQCYVLAAAQVGNHGDARRTYGYSMIIDPWGKVLAIQEEGEGVIHAELSLHFISDVHKKLPKVKHGEKKNERTL